MVFHLVVYFALQMSGVQTLANISPLRKPRPSVHQEQLLIHESAFLSDGSHYFESLPLLFSAIPRSLSSLQWKMLRSPSRNAVLVFFEPAWHLSHSRPFRPCWNLTNLQIVCRCGLCASVHQENTTRCAQLSLTCLSGSIAKLFRWPFFKPRTLLFLHHCSRTCPVR